MDANATLVACDRCGRLSCMRCFKFDMSVDELETVFFLCFHCHIKDGRSGRPEPYMVRTSWDVEH